MFVYTNCYRKYLVSGRQDHFAFYFLLDNLLFVSLFLGLKILFRRQS